MDVGCEAVRLVSDHGEPAARIEEIGDRIADRCELEAFNRAALGIIQQAVVAEGVGIGLALQQRLRRGDANRCVGSALTVEGLPVAVGDGGDAECPVQLKDGGIEVCEGGEGDPRTSVEHVGCGIESRVDRVGGDVDRRLLERRRLKRKWADSEKESLEEACSSNQGRFLHA